MAAHSFVEVGQPWLLASRESYIPDIAALFTEMELRDEGERYGYVSSVGELRDRLQLHGFTAKRALDLLSRHGARWRPAVDPDGCENASERYGPQPSASWHDVSTPRLEWGAAA